jgi:hypothetical protein
MKTSPRLPGGAVRICCAGTFHVTPGNPLTAVAGLTFRLRGK